MFYYKFCSLLICVVNVYPFLFREFYIIMSFPFKKRPSRILISFTENKQFLKPTIYQVQIFKKSPEFVPRGQEADDRQNNCFNNFNGLYTKYLSPFRMELFRKSYVTISKMSCSSPTPKSNTNKQ